MEGKLKKIGNDYKLYAQDDSCIATTHESPYKKLSLKNCEAIANGYDLDEVVEDIVKTIVPNDRGEDIWYGTSMAVGKLCFKTALEILGDKKFSEFLDKEKELGISDIKTIERIQWYYKTYFDKSQQTEFDVEIEMENKQQLTNGYKNQPDNVIGFIAAYENVVVPKLDEDGCLILEKK